MSHLAESQRLEVYVEDEFFEPPTENPIPPTLWEEWLNTWLQRLDPDLPEAMGYEVSLRFTGDRAIQDLNRQYRHKDQPTDVLAFAALESELHPPDLLSDEPLYLGDLVISIETAQRQAQEQSHPLKTELVWLASHGFLHLLGWDHPDAEHLSQMLAQQEKLLKTVGFVLHDQ